MQSSCGIRQASSFPPIRYGNSCPADSSFIQECRIDDDVYKKIVHKDGVIAGAIFRGDIDNCGAYPPLVWDKVPVGGVGKPPRKPPNADLFRQAANGEFLQRSGRRGDGENYAPSSSAIL